MSCNRTGLKIALGSARAGISDLGNRTAGVVATTAARLDRLNEAAGRTVAPATNLAMRFIGPQSPETRRAVGATAAAVITTAGLFPAGRRGLRRGAGLLAAGGKAGLQVGVHLVPHARTAYVAAKAVEKGTSLVGVAAGNLTKTGEAGQVVREKRRFLVGTAKIPVELWSSSLTPLFNRRDILTRQVISSKGVMFESDGQVWHRGTTVVKTSTGRRTITHLQSLNAPATHFYFSRPISNEQAVGLASGQLKPEETPGYVAGVSRLESLAPALAQAKHALIRAHLHWPGGG